uniref:Uncharacterized protein n=1 Tax=Timema tahoe TaxID=61484 RepID=A0A7R9NWF8_9NEOP|nr:unnamed protein product [Timema tahoe]
MADLEAVLADVSYLMAMEKSKCTPAARASKKIILPDPSVRSVMHKYLEKKGEVNFDKIFNQMLVSVYCKLQNMCVLSKLLLHVCSQKSHGYILFGALQLGHKTNFPHDLTDFFCGKQNNTCVAIEASIRGIQSAKDGLKHYNYQCNTVSFTKNFITKGHGAHKLYLFRLEEEKRIEVERKKQDCPATHRLNECRGTCNEILTSQGDERLPLRTGRVVSTPSYLHQDWESGYHTILLASGLGDALMDQEENFEINKIKQNRVCFEPDHLQPPITVNPDQPILDSSSVRVIAADMLLNTGLPLSYSGYSRYNLTSIPPSAMNPPVYNAPTMLCVDCILTQVQRLCNVVSRLYLDASTACLDCTLTQVQRVWTVHLKQVQRV